MTGLAAAVTEVDITPATGRPMGGYIAREGVSTGVHDRLRTTLVWITDHESHIVWVAVDTLGIAAVDCARLRARVAASTGVPADSVLICASHTHSAPSGWLRPIYAGFPSAADEGLIDALIDTVGTAACTLRPRPVEARWAVCENVGIGTNRNDPVGPHDDSTGVLTLDGTAGILARVADYACHPTVLGRDNLRYSADYPGAARTVLGPLAFLQGAAGDASTRFIRREQTFAEVDRLGGMLGAAIGAADGVPVSGPVRVRRNTVTVPVRTIPDTDPPVPALRGRLLESRREGARLLHLLRAADLPAALDLPISVVEIGPVAWVHLPVEPFASYGAAIIAGSRHPVTRVVGYTDGYFGYLADAAAHAAGTYEAQASMFDPAAGDLVVEAAVELLNS